MHGYLTQSTLWDQQWVWQQLFHVLLAWLLVYAVNTLLYSRRQPARQNRATCNKQEVRHGTQDASCQANFMEKCSSDTGQPCAQGTCNDVQLGLLMLQLCGSACPPEELHDMHQAVRSLWDSLHGLQRVCMMYTGGNQIQQQQQQHSAPSLASSHASTPKHLGTTRLQRFHDAASELTPSAGTPAKSCRSINIIGREIVAPLAHAIVRALMNDSRGDELHTARAVHTELGSCNQLSRCETDASGLASPKFSVDSFFDFCWLLPPLHMFQVTEPDTGIDHKASPSNTDQLGPLPQQPDQPGQQVTSSAGQVQHVQPSQACSMDSTPALVGDMSGWPPVSPTARPLAAGAHNHSHLHPFAVQRSRHYSDSPRHSPVKRLTSNCASEGGAAHASPQHSVSRSPQWQASMWVQDESLLLSEVALWASRAARAEQQAQNAQRAADGALEQMGLLEEAIAGCHEREAKLQVMRWMHANMLAARAAAAMLAATTDELDSIRSQAAEQTHAMQRLAGQHLQLIAHIQKAACQLHAAGRQGTSKSRPACKQTHSDAKHVRPSCRLRACKSRPVSNRCKAVFRLSMHLLDIWEYCSLSL